MRTVLSRGLCASLLALLTHGSIAQASILQVPVVCTANMKNGGHTFKHGPLGTMAMILRDEQGVLAVGYPDLSWIQRAKPVKASWQQSILAESDPLQYVAPRAATLSGDVRVTLDICVREDPKADAALSKCGPMPTYGDKRFGDKPDRPFHITDLPVEVKISGAGAEQTFRVMKFTGDLPIASREDVLDLSCVHPVYAMFLQGVVDAKGVSYAKKERPDAYSPLVIDLDGNGRLDLINIAEHPVRFDLEGDGKAMQIGWVKPADALLALDANGDGKINDGSELFGEFTYAAVDQKRNGWYRKFVNGFQALQQYDANLDGVLDAKDPAFAQLLFWRDLNGDGISTGAELTPVSATAVASFDLGYERTSRTGDYLRVEGNEVRYTATAVLKNGHKRLVGDVWFKTFDDVAAANN